MDSQEASNNEEDGQEDDGKPCPEQVESAASKKKRGAAAQKGDIDSGNEQAGQEAECKKASFARRNCPSKDAFASQKWKSIKNTFELMIAPKLKLASKAEARTHNCLSKPVVLGDYFCEDAVAGVV